jgi:hypothetical protein
MGVSLPSLRDARAITSSVGDEEPFTPDQTFRHLFERKLRSGCETVARGLRDNRKGHPRHSMSNRFFLLEMHVMLRRPRSSALLKET